MQYKHVLFHNGIFVGREMLVSLSHRPRLSYTEAVLHEAMRMYPIAPLALPRATSCDVDIRKCPPQYILNSGSSRCPSTSARFLSPAENELRLCWANQKPGYWSKLPCEWLSTVWACLHKRQETGPGCARPSTGEVVAKGYTWIHDFENEKYDNKVIVKILTQPVFVTYHYMVSHTRERGLLCITQKRKIYFQAIFTVTTACN